MPPFHPARPAGRLPRVPSRVWLLVAAVLVSGTARAAPAYAYEATLAQRALVGGVFQVGTQRWSCMGTLLQCQGELASPRPTVADCQALVRRIGAVTAFGRVGGPALRADELMACNVTAREQPPSGLPRRGSSAAVTAPGGPVALSAPRLRLNGETRSCPT